jgi:hypothetical protein
MTVPTESRPLRFLGIIRLSRVQRKSSFPFNAALQ